MHISIINANPKLLYSWNMYLNRNSLSVSTFLCPLSLFRFHNDFAFVVNFVSIRMEMQLNEKWMIAFSSFLFFCCCCKFSVLGFCENLRIWISRVFFQNFQINFWYLLQIRNRKSINSEFWFHHHQNNDANRSRNDYETPFKLQIHCNFGLIIMEYDAQKRVTKLLNMKIIFDNNNWIFPFQMNEHRKLSVPMITR